MNAQNDNNTRKGLLGWWLTPQRPGLQRFIAPWEYRYLRFFGTLRVAGGGIALAASLICAAYGVYGWAGFFFVIAALNLAGGGWFLSIDRDRTAAASA